MYICKSFKVGKTGSLFSSKTAYTDAGMVEKLYESIVEYANSNNLDIVKISGSEDSMMKTQKIVAIFKKR